MGPPLVTMMPSAAICSWVGLQRWGGECEGVGSRRLIQHMKDRRYTLNTSCIQCCVQQFDEGGGREGGGQEKRGGGGSYQVQEE